jgi:NADPH:quinone reductase-like Zn-dependent oxidoreductase
MGTACIQFAKLSGFTVITVCSPSNFNLVKSYGADHILDYHDPTAPDQIKVLTKNELKLAIDCISVPDNQAGAKFCAKVLASDGKYSMLGPMVSCGREDVQDIPTVGYSFLGEEWSMMGQTFPASPQDFAFSMRFADVIEKLLADGKIRPHPVEARDGGLDAFPQAMEDLRNGKVSGKKLVVMV